MFQNFFLKIIFFVFLMDFPLVCVAKIIIYSVDPLPFKISSTATVIKDENELCKYHKIIIYGLKSYLKTQKIKCYSQKRIVAGVLYLNLIYKNDEVYFSPLPSAGTYKKFGEKFSVIYSPCLSFYIKYLKKHLNIIAVKVDKIYELEGALREVLKKDRIFIILPDPKFIDKRGQLILTSFFKKYPFQRVIDLLNLKIPVKNKILITYDPYKLYYNLFRLYDKIDGINLDGQIVYTDY